MFENFITKPILEKGYKNYVSEVKANSKTPTAKTRTCGCGSTKGLFTDNICPSCELVRRQGKPDDIKDGGITSNSGYTFRTYESSEPTVTTKKPESETRFQQDNDKQKYKGKKVPGAEAGKVLKTAGVSPEYDTRGSGTVYPMAGLSNVNFKEQKANKYTSTAEVTRKSFNKFRQESMDSPSTEMGVTGGYHGPSNKEPLVTQLDKTLNQDSNIKKKKK
jgi:hypothetical protein